MPAETRKYYFSVPMTDTEHRKMKARLKSDGKPLSTFIRDAFGFRKLAIREGRGRKPKQTPCPRCKTMCDSATEARAHCRHAKDAA